MPNQSGLDDRHLATRRVISEGTRVRWSAVRRARDPNKEIRLGTVVGFTLDRRVYVLWDGNGSPRALPLGFVEIVEKSELAQIGKAEKG